MKTTILSIFILSAFSALSQTIVSDIPIESKKPYKAEVLASDGNWYDITETGLEYSWGWYYNEEINIKIKSGDIGRFRFITCSDTTSLKIYGSEKRYKISHKETNLSFLLDGRNKEWGTKAPSAQE